MSLLSNDLSAAVQHQEAGRLADAERIYREILQASPNDPVVLQLLGTLIAPTGRLDEAIALIDRAISFAPNVPGFHNNLANLLREKGRIQSAIDSYQRGIELDPHDHGIHGNLAETYNNLGVILADQELFEEAINTFRKAIQHNNDYAEAHTNLGTVLKQAGRFDEAIAAHQAALRLRPDFAEALCNLGVAQADNGRLNEAIVSLKRAIQLKPDYADATINLAVSLCNVGQPEQSAALCHRSLTLAPHLDAALCNIAQVFLTLGDFENGWREYERRWAANPRIRPVPLSTPRWSGESLAGKTILLHAEQGLGDAIQFVRYAPLVAARGARVILECRPELVELFQSLETVAEVISIGQPLPRFDLHCPLMSLPLVMGTTLGNVPADVPYLYVPDHAQKPKLGSGFHVGLVWAGHPTHSNDRNRSMTLNHFEPLSVIPNVTFHTLQKGIPALQASNPPAAMTLADHTTELHTFIDTAALISQLDLVIAVDTSVAHLAGALGKPVWVLLPFVPDWRWMRDREDSPWYPTMRLFRQKRWGDWNAVITQVAGSLRKKVTNEHE